MYKVKVSIACVVFRSYIQIIYYIKRSRSFCFILIRISNLERKKFKTWFWI